MHSLKLPWYGAVLGLCGVVTAAPGKLECPDGIATVQVQPYEIVYDGISGPTTTTSLCTSTLTNPHLSSSILADHYNAVKGGSSDEFYTLDAENDHCDECAVFTTFVETPFCKTIAPAIKGGVRTIITGVAPSTKTIMTTGPTPFVKKIAPAYGHGVATVVVCEQADAAPKQHVRGYVTQTVPGIEPGAVTILPTKGCEPNCVGTVRVTVPSDDLFVTRVPGPVPGTAVIQPPADCSDNCNPIVRITTLPWAPDNGYSTIRVPGERPFTTTLQPDAACTTDCEGTVIIVEPTLLPQATRQPTNNPIQGIGSDLGDGRFPPSNEPGEPIVVEVPGPVAGTQTILPATDCVGDCPTLIKVTTVPDTTPTGFILTTVPGEIPGTETVLLPSGCVTDCETLIVITQPSSSDPEATEGPEAEASERVPIDERTTTGATETAGGPITREILGNDLTSSPEATPTETPADPTDTSAESTTTEQTETAGGPITRPLEDLTTTADPATETGPGGEATGTGTGTGTATNGPAPEPTPEGCTPGMQWAFYSMRRSPSDEQTFPGQIPNLEGGEAAENWRRRYFSVQEVLRDQAPGTTGSSRTIGIGTQCSGTRSLYDMEMTGDATYMVLQHIGYFRPALSGTYTFAFSGVDDAVFLWLGNNAVSGFSNGEAGNANLDINFYDPGRSGSFSGDFVAGTYWPYRILYVNAQGCGAFDFTLTDPEGVVVVSNSVSNQRDELTQGCDAGAPAPFTFSGQPEIVG
ncbi:GLEYA domain-containing protein [Stachybotrys elegans]|uniref:GLEYA domain-containing protein n=1 Tax=Stachybotrys elegans TaxID=80388 RepID=A0A8K0SLR3_9HYPO|nr:GLEYA domain-containing protein [Stachybotrys elegans]